MNGDSYIAQCNSFEKYMKSTEGHVPRAQNVEQRNEVMKLEKAKYRVATMATTESFNAEKSSRNDLLKSKPATSQRAPQYTGLYNLIKGTKATFQEATKKLKKKPNTRKNFFGNFRKSATKKSPQRSPRQLASV